MKATSALIASSSSSLSVRRSISCTRWPVAVSAMAAARPDRSDTSRSDDGPPMRTAMVCLLFLISPSSPHQDFQVEKYAPPRRDFRADAVDQGQDIVGRRAALVDDEIGMKRRHAGGARPGVLEPALVDEPPRLL